tara:strand:- start:4185 stop:4316 length:132 start_codon:yes stop_codon:yes gene_type:complete
MKTMDLQIAIHPSPPRAGARRREIRSDVAQKIDSPVFEARKEQ